MTLTAKKTYKGQDIYIIEDALGQTFNVVIGCFDKIFHTTADAKRYINHKEDYTYLPITPSASGNFNEIMGFARKTALQALQAPETPAEPATFEDSRKALADELKDIMTDAKERVEDFVASTLKGYGDLRLQSYTPDRFSIALYKNDKPVFGAYWDVYVDRDYVAKASFVRCNINTAGSFPLGRGNEREVLYIAFGRFLSMMQEVRMDKYLCRVHEQSMDVWHRFYRLCDQYGRDSAYEGLFGE